MHTSTTFTGWTLSIPFSPFARISFSLPPSLRLPHRPSKRNLRRSTPRFPTTPMRSLSHRILEVKLFWRSQSRRTGSNGASTTSRPSHVRTNDSNARTLRMQAYRSMDSAVRSSSRAGTSSTRHSTSSHPPCPLGQSLLSLIPTPLVEEWGVLRRRPLHLMEWRVGTTLP